MAANRFTAIQIAKNIAAAIWTSDGQVLMPKNWNTGNKMLLLFNGTELNEAE